MLGGAAHDNPSQWGFCGELVAILTPSELRLGLDLHAVSPYEENLGQFCLSGKLGAKWERPGICETSSGVGMFPTKLGISWVRAFSNGIGGSSVRGWIRSPFTFMWCCGRVPCIVVVM